MSILCQIIAALPLILASATPFDVIPDKTELVIETPSLRDQKTLKIRLPNGLQAVLVSDPEVKQSSVAISVMAGSWQDPDTFPGLAHFLEHMLFLGTSEFPVESDFGRYLAEFDGQTNAYTTGDYTSFMFAINTAGLPEALQRFASFFKSPLFNPSGVGRELNAIDSEFAKGFNDEFTREYHVLKDLADPQHPLHRFQTGNSHTLSKASTDDLRKWFDEHYSADLMRLYVLSSLPLEQIRDMVVKDFSGIPNKNKERYKPSENVFPSSTLGHFVHIESQKNVQNLSLTWKIPASMASLLESKPEELICYVLGHEGEKSLLAQLKQEGLATALRCGAINLGASLSLFSIEIELTSKGFGAIDTVIQRVFQTLNRISSQPFPESLYQDYAQILKQQYQYQEREEPFEWAMTQGQWLSEEPIETYPELSRTLRKFDRKAIESFLKELNPESAIFVIMAPEKDLKIKLDKIEPWMQIGYTVEKIPSEKLEAWKKSDLHPNILLPKTNPFIAKTFEHAEAVAAKTDYAKLPPPQLLIENEGTKFYYAQDPFYQIPRTYLKIQIQSPEIKDGNPQAMVLTDLLVKNLEDSTSELAYDAKMADLDLKFERGFGAVEISIEGFTDSLTTFLPKIMEKLTNVTISENNFNDFKEVLQRDYVNFSREMPVKQAFDQLKASIYEHYTTYQQKSNAIKMVKLDTYKSFLDKVFNKTYLQGVIVGSLSKERALSFMQPLEKAFHKDLESNALPYTPLVKDLPGESGPYLQTTPTLASGDALLLVLEVPGFSPRLRNNQQLLAQAMEPAFFKELRTKQQTGYLIASDAVDLHKHLFSYFTVQSTTHVPDELLWRFEQFFEAYLQRFATQEITEERFELLKDALQTKLKEPPSSLGFYGLQLFKLAFDVQDFSWMKERQDDLAKLTYEEFTEFAKEFLSRSNKRRLAIVMQGSGKEKRFLYTPIKSVKTLSK